jgi:hypothetical protein
LLNFSARSNVVYFTIWVIAVPSDGSHGMIFEDSAGGAKLVREFLAR